MTRKEAIECNKNLKMYMKLADKNQPCKFLEDNYIALDMAINSLEIDEKYELEYENAEDIHREKEQAYMKGYEDASKKYRQEPKTGHWIDTDETHSKCDRCGAVFEIASGNGEANYCPNCGAKMEESEE